MVTALEQYIVYVELCQMYNSIAVEIIMVVKLTYACL